MAPKAKEKPKGASSQPTIAIEDLFASLNKFISRSEYEQAVKVATQVLSTSPGDEDALRCKIVALVKADNIDEAFTVIQSSQKLPIDLSFLKAYCMYRLNKLDEALESLKSQERSTATMLLESQILYRLGRMDACLDIYQKLQNSSVDSLEINFVAGLVGAGRSSEVQRVLENLKIKPTSSFELAYNTACSLIEKNKYVDAEQLLLSARRVGQESLMEENWADDDIENELAPIAVQLAYVQQLLGNTQEAAQAYLELIKHNLADESSLAIATNNLISLRGPKEISDSLKKLDRLIEKGDGGQFQLALVLESKLSVKQKEAVYVNRALLLLHANKIDQVRELVSASVGMFPDSVTPVLLQAAVLVRENKAGRAEEVLGQFAGKYPDKSKVFLLARAQVAAAAGHFQVAAESLSKIPDIQHMPATVATIVALKERFGDIDGAEVVLDNAIKWWSNAMTEDSKLTVIMQEAASFKLKHGRQLPNGVMKASQRDLQALECQLSETLAGNTKSHYTEMICGLGSFGKDLDITDVEDLQTRTVSSDSGDVPLPRTVIESSSLRRMVESLKDELETMKKEHAGLNDNDAGAEFAARNLHFSFFKSEPENGGCLAKMDKTGETSEKVSQDNNEVNDLKNKAKGLKRDLDAAKFSSKVEKRPRIALDIDETREGVVRLLDQAKSFPEGTHPGCVSTSESSARVMISEDELESSSQQVGMSANFDRETLISPVGGVEGGKCDYASEFSIRDFVFAARNRDISQNWPFSEKNLQICLKHGVKHVLPPFKPVVSLRDSSIKRCLAGKILQSEESSLHEKQSMMRNHIVPGTIPELVCSWHQDLAEGYRDSDLFPSGGERDLAFKTNAAANSQSEMGSVSTSNLPLSEVSDEREAAGSAANNKTNSSASQLTRKKSKMAMKMRVNNKRNSPEDITSACTAPPETIYSQVCPVCESFSSPSNTTLNAHIDQCLSSQSPPIWMKSSKVMKPRIKPRKMRLMADICATAPCCTLEDLDRRNGTNWATNVDFPLEEADVPAERNNPGVSSRYLLNNADDDSVYIDSSGRKIRILSKFNDMPQSSFSKAREDLRPKKQSGKAKRSKFFSSNRKKRFAKHLMFLNVTRQRKRSFSLKVKGRSSDGCWPKEAVRTIGVRQQPTSFVKEAREQNHPGAVGSAKRCTSLLKNSDSEAITKFSRCEVQAAEESLIGSDQVGSAEVEPRTPVKKSMDFPKRFLSSTQSSLKTPAGVDQKSEGYSRGKMLGGRLLRGAVRENRDASQVSLNSGATQFNRKIGKVSRPISLDSTTAPLPLCEREADIQPNVVQNAAISFPATRGLLVSCHVGPSEGMKSCDLNTMLSPSRSCVHVCQANSDKLGSALDNSRDCKGDNEAEAWSGDISQQSGAVIDHPISCRITESLGRSSVVKVRQTQAMKYGQDVSNDSNSNDGLTDDICGNYGCVRSAIKVLHDDGEFIASASSSGLAIGVNETSLRTAFDPERERIADVSPQSKLLQCSDKFQGPLFRGQLGLNDSTETCEGNTGDAQRLDQKVGDYIPNFSHGSSFPEVDPIPIPGPPGSDLPSFSDMGSEDLHRSSLSSSLVQLSGDSDDVADGDLSECPFSAISAISNFGRSRTNDVTVNEQESVNVYPGWFDVGPRPLPGMSIVSSQITAAENERITRADNMEKGKVNLGGGGVMRNGDCQQRYCSQKDEITQSTMNSPDSRHLGWRLTTSTSFSVGSHSYSVLDGQSIGLNDRSAVFSASSYNRKESVNLANSVETSHQSIISLVNSAEAANLLPRAGNCDSTIPSAPVLRLMGKDLRVSNLVGADFSRSQADIDVGMNKLVKGSWEPESSQSPALIGSLHEQNPHYLPARHFDVGSSNVIHSFGSHNQASSDIYLNEHMHTSFSVLGAGPWQR